MSNKTFLIVMLVLTGLAGLMTLWYWSAFW